MSRLRFLTSAVLLAASVSAAALAGETAPDAREALRPAEDDFSAGLLRRYQTALLAPHGSAYAVPLDVKAAHLEWVLTRYCLAPWNQVHPRVRLPVDAGRPVTYHVGGDLSTWNGALLSALSHKYAVTKDAETLRLIGQLLDGMHLYLKVTGQPGLPARCVMRSDAPIGDVKHRYVAADGTVYHYRSDAAKGTVNQIVCGYVMLMMYAYDDLPADKQQLARDDLASIVVHLIAHDYRLTERDGSQTEFGDLTPVVATQGIPFNAQVAYLIVAAGTYFPPDDPAQARRIYKEFERLRAKHHVYFESPLTHLILPQRVGGSPFVKGMNDRNHVLNAAHAGLALELHAARREGRPLDAEFLNRLGETMYWTMDAIQHLHNALCNFMWAGLLSDPRVFAAVIRGDEERTRRQLAYVTAAGVEQLRRFPIDRFYYPGRHVPTRDPQWVDARGRHDGYLWKADPFQRWDATAPPTDDLIASIDFLHAYWVMRYYRLDEQRSPAAP